MSRCAEIPPRPVAAPAPPATTPAPSPPAPVPRARRGKVQLHTGRSATYTRTTDRQNSRSRNLMRS
ncbi:hypothetical protein EYW49_09900 [Siculibacillus lacustris]|uniref:Uncharacterized protein n=1 Tax=Siculibacillus lacustris TaxID=1549641 RepID=A0A4Q9VQX5_9HYPH|nr:hypothetical protein EYW49_09900 [Siculibacillus lacustris]